VQRRKKYQGYIKAKILIQACILEISEVDERTRAKLITQMDKYLTDELDQKLFNLPLQ